MFSKKIGCTNPACDAWGARDGGVLSRTDRHGIALACAALACAVLSCLLQVSQARAGDGAKSTTSVRTDTDTVVATAASLTVEGDATIFSLVLSKGVQAKIFTLDSPYRIIIDLPDASFNLPPGTGSEPNGLIKVFRYGLFAEHKARLVIEATGPVKLASAGMTRAGSGSSVVLNIKLVATDEVTFAAGIGSGGEADKEAEEDASALPSPKPPKGAKSKPIVVVDAGHGGIDPGAIGANNLNEKNIVLAVAQQLAATLEKSGHYEVRMTRTRDVFVSLDKRLKLSAEFGADLFISLHADSISETAFAENVRGATIYTLSEKATDERSRLMAEKENASDLIAGLSGVDESGKDQVKDILFDLMRRETSNFSANFSKLLAARLTKSIAMSKDPQRSAAFKVLKQAHAPSVLVELGYMSNSRDQAEMTSKGWQEKVSTSIAAAVESYFNNRTAVQR